jgi:hypothetical protein
MYLITCYTLFDITYTGVLNRQNPPAGENDSWYYKRNTQCNFDTILQAINMRSQPEIIKNPKSITIDFNEFNKFGYLYESKEKIKCWTFEFTVSHRSVFDDGISELGALYNDCNGVPMIKCGTEFDKISNTLDITDELKNIYFEVSSYE